MTIRRPPSAQSSFAWRKRYSRQGGVTHHLEGHYPSVLAPTSSCARPPSSAGSSCSALISSGLCRLRPAPAGRGSFPTLRCKSFPGCLGPDPGGSSGAHACFFPHVVGLPQNPPMGRLPASIRSETSERWEFRDRRHSLRSGLLVCSPPRSLLPLRPQRRRAAVTSTPEQNTHRHRDVHRVC